MLMTAGRSQTQVIILQNSGAPNFEALSFEVKLDSLKKRDTAI